MLDGTVGGAPLNSFAINRSAYNIELAIASTVRPKDSVQIKLRKSISLADCITFRSKTNLSKFSGLSLIGEMSVKSKSRITLRLKAQGKGVFRDKSHAEVTARRSAIPVGHLKALDAATSIRRVSTSSVEVIKFTRIRSSATLRQSVTGKLSLKFNDHLNLRSLSRISASGNMLTLEKANVVRRVVLNEKGAAIFAEQANITRRQKLDPYGYIRINGRVKLPHIKFEEIDAYRALKLTSENRKITIQRQVHKFYVPYEKRCSSIYRQDRYLAVPNFEEGK